MRCVRYINFLDSLYTSWTELQFVVSFSGRLNDSGSKIEIRMSFSSSQILSTFLLFCTYYGMYSSLIGLYGSQCRMKCARFSIVSPSQMQEGDFTFFILYFLYEIDARVHPAQRGGFLESKRIQTGLLPDSHGGRG